MRIISLLPSATESLCLIGAGDEIVGRSHECDHPGEIIDRPAVSKATTTVTESAEIDRVVSEALARGESLYRLDEARVQELAPDLIVTQDLCDVCSIDVRAVRALAAKMDSPPRVLCLNPQSFEGVLDDVLTLGTATAHEREAEAALFALRDRYFRTADSVNPYTHHPSVLFLEWTDPLYIGGHWTPQLIERAGGAHPLNPTAPMAGAGAGAGGQWAHRTAGKSIRVTHEQIVDSAPQFVIVCPCGLSLEQAIAETRKLADQSWWKSLPAVNTGRVAVVDGNEMFSRPGPRLVDAYEFLVGYLNDLPELIPEDFPWQPFEQ